MNITSIGMTNLTILKENIILCVFSYSLTFDDWQFMLSLILAVSALIFFNVEKSFKVNYLNNTVWFLLQIHVHVNQDDYTFFKHSFTCSGTFKKRPFTEQCNSFMKILPAHFIPQCTAYHVSIKHRVNEITWIILRFRKIVEVNLKCSIVKLF